MKRPITERMEEAKRKMLDVRKRAPRVFFLGPEDFEEFAATDPPKMLAAFNQGGKPSMLECLSFGGIAVRLSRAERQKHTGRYQATLFAFTGITILVRPE